MNPDPLLSKGSTMRTTPPSGLSSSGTARGRVNPQSATSTPRLRVYMLYCAEAIIPPPPPTLPAPPPPLSLFCKWPLPHHFTYTLQPLSSGDRPGSNCGFCACSPPHPSSSKEPRPLVSCHHITACRPRGLMTGSIVHENTIIALGSIATV